MKYLLPILALSLLIACQSEPTPATQSEIPFAEQPQARVPDAWIADRTEAVRAQLAGSTAGQRVLESMQAHGGLENFYRNGPLEFTFDYRPLDGSTRRYSTQQVDTWNHRARHQDAQNPSAEFGWTGKNAWTTDTSAFAYDLRFWALTPYYFLGQPFVFAGEGVQLEDLGKRNWNGTDYDAVKVTFAAGTGDAPDDYYVAYFHPVTKLQEVIRYIVSYPAYFPDGGHLPEKMMVLEDFTTVSGITFPTRYRTFWLDDNEQPGEHITTITVSNIAFNATLPKSHFDQPVGSISLGDTAVE